MALFRAAKTRRTLFFNDTVRAKMSYLDPNDAKTMGKYFWKARCSWILRSKRVWIQGKTKEFGKNGSFQGFARDWNFCGKKWCR